MQEKILLRLEILNRSSSYAKLYEIDASDEIKVVAQKIKGFTDVNLGVEYRYNQALSGFISMNNLLSQRQYLWNNYPSYRFNVLLGVTYSF
ncbi:MAG: hypothetical protein R2759_16325 [Bacteroidales bacterium]